MNASETEFDNGASEFQEEWLSAYLDDELSHHQRAIVEDRLATDEASQALLEDLQRIRGLVTELPNWDRPTVAVPLTEVATEDDVGLDDVDATPAAVVEQSTPQETTEIAEEPESAEEPELDQNSELEGIAEVEGLGLQDSLELVAPSLQRSKQKVNPFGWWRPAALAASVLVMSGLGYMLWVGDSLTKLAVSTQTTAEPESKPTDASQQSDSDNAAMLGGKALGETGESITLALPADQESGMEMDRNIASLSAGSVEAVESESAPEPIAPALALKKESTAPAIDAFRMSEGRSQKSENPLSLGLTPVPSEPERASRMRRGTDGESDRLESPKEEHSNKEQGVAETSQELELLPGKSDDQPAPKRSTIYFARSAAWTDIEAAQAIAATSTLLGRRFASTDSMSHNSGQALANRNTDGLDSPRVSPSPVAIARLHGTATDTFSALMDDSYGLNEFNLIESAEGNRLNIGAPSRSLDRSDAGAAGKPFGIWGSMGSADGNEPKSQQSLGAVDKSDFSSETTSGARADVGDSASGELPPPATSNLQLDEKSKQEPGNALKRSSGSYRSYDTGGESILLLISRSEADAILQSPALRSQDESRPASLLWITPITRTTAPQPTDKVILLLNPRAN